MNLRYRPRGNATRRSQVNTTSLPSEQAPRPGPVTDADDMRLAALRRRVVEPVVTSVLKPEEIETLSVHWGLDGRAGDVWVRIDVPDGRHEELLLSPWWVPDPRDVDVPTDEAQIAAQRGERLGEWICKTTFAWGQQRRACYKLPEIQVGAHLTPSTSWSRRRPGCRRASAHVDDRVPAEHEGHLHIADDRDFRPAPDLSDYPAAQKDGGLLVGHPAPQECNGSSAAGPDNHGTPSTRTCAVLEGRGMSSCPGTSR